MKLYLVLVVIFFQEINSSLSRIRSDCACGESNVRGINGRIVNGKQVIPHKYPWMAAMFTPEAFMCGGAIISDKNILTAGHCIFYVSNPLNTYWVLGMDDQILKDGYRYNVAHYMLHPKFKNLTIYDDFDLALVTVVNKIKFGYTVKPICLPQAYESHTGKAGSVAGWGRLNEEMNAPMAAHLMETKIRVKHNQECRVEVKRLVDFNDESMICGYEFQKDACQGDSGGPFFIETDPNRYEVFGVVSFGDGCARNFPGIYSRLSEPQTLLWIKTYIYNTDGNVCEDPMKTNKQSLFEDLKNLLSL